MFIKYIYFILVFTNIGVLLLDKKKINFITIYFLSSLVYYLNSFLGQIYVKNYDFIFGFDINKSTFVIMVINMLLILFFQLLPNFKIKDNRDSAIQVSSDKNMNDRQKAGEKLTINFITLGMLLMGLYIILKFNLLSSTSFNKTIILENTNFFVTYYKSIALFLFVYIFLNKKVKYSKITYLSIIFAVLVTFLLGHRSYIVIGILGITFNYILVTSNKEINMLKYILKNKKIIIFGLALILMVYSIKGVFNPLITGQYELVMTRLSDPDFYLNSFKISESNSIFSYIDKIVSQNYRVNQSTYIIIPSYFIPFVSRYLPSTTFGTLLQRDLFPNLREGSLGSTFIGEAFANGGLIMVIFVIFFIMILLKILFSLYQNCTNTYLKTFLLLCGSEFSFYVHRNGLGTVILRIRIYLYILILFLILTFIFRIFSNSLSFKKYPIK